MAISPMALCTSQRRDVNRNPYDAPGPFEGPAANDVAGSASGCAMRHADRESGGWARRRGGRPLRRVDQVLAALLELVEVVKAES